MKFARNVQFQIKNGKESEFNKVVTNELIPMMKKQPGFEQELTLVNRNMAMGISVWDDKSHAEAYQSSTYPRLLEKLTPLIEGTPRVETYEVTATTLPA
jgi:quinol monooxygenase YgiN